MSNVVRFPRHRARVIDDPRRRLALAGISFDEWVEANKDHIWQTLVESDLRDTTFNDCAEQAWSAQ